ncbi:MAG: sulfotransferase [Rickettsiales bacterium]|nr:sulfotransferase [Rickettsiales bacterium]
MVKKNVLTKGMESLTQAQRLLATYERRPDMQLLKDAEACLQQAQQAHPESGQIYVLRSAIYQHLNRRQQALVCLGKAYQLDPESPAVLHACYRGYDRYGLLPEALEFAKKFCAIQPDIEAFEQLYTALYRLNRHNEAIEVCIQASALHPDANQFNDWRLLLLEKNNQLDEDFEDSGAAPLLRTRINWRNKQYVPLEENEINTLQSLNRIAGWFERARAFHALEDYDAAWESYRLGNEIYAKTSEVSKEARYKMLNKYNAWLDGIEQMEPVTTQGKGPIFILGFPRSGTTLIEQMLAAHSQLYPSSELNFLSELMAGLPNMPNILPELTAEQVKGFQTAYGQRARAYLTELSDKRVLDKQPINTVHLGGIQYLFPQSPVLFIVRDPRAVCLSCFQRMFALNPSNVHFLTMEDTVNYYCAVMDYYLKIRGKLKLSLKEVKYEEIVSSPEPVLREIVDFIGEEWEDGILQYHTHKRALATPNQEGISKPVYTSAMQNWRHYEKQFEPFQDQLAAYVKLFGYE